MKFVNLFNDCKLNNIINMDKQNQTVSHAYLLCGQDEIYLNYLANELARKLLTDDHNEDCGCSTCKKITNFIHSDVLTYPKDNAMLVVDDINQVVEQSFVYPLEGNKKVFILKNFDVCTVQAQNKLLKTLEEPNDYVTFILTTTVPSAVLPTIKSRTKIIDIEPVLLDGVKRFLKANFDLKGSEFETYAISSNQNLTRLIKIVNDADFLKIKAVVVDVFVNMQSSSDILKYSSKLCSYKGKLNEILDEFNLVIRDLSFIVTNNSGLVLNQQNLNILQKSNYSLKALNDICKLVLLSQAKLKSNCNPNAVVDSLLLGMLEAKYKWK